MYVYIRAGLYESHKVAIKKHTLDQGGLDAKAISDLELEVGKMTAVNHPCIVRCFGMLEPTAGIVLELVEGGVYGAIISSACRVCTTCVCVCVYGAFTSSAC